MEVALRTGNDGLLADDNTALSNGLHSFCIGEIEPELHKTFAVMRAPSENYVYVESEGLYQELDEFCDDASMRYQNPPLVISGRSGLGKSALLSNWLLRRTHQRRKKHSQPTPKAGGSSAQIGTNFKEFIFWHVAGCSRTSCLTTHMLRRLESELKAHFDLTKEVSKDDDRLRWDLPTFLEMAARKGPMILIIDGIHRLRDEDGEEDMKWLPLTFPGNVRLIVSTTVYQEKEEEALDSRRNRTLIELKRRGWDMVQVDEMSSRMRKDVLISYLKLTAERLAINLPHCDSSATSISDGGGGRHSLDSSSMTTISTVQAAPPPSAAALNLPILAPLLLFPSQHRAILASTATTSPLYLRLLLKALHWSASRKMDFWQVFPYWIKADSVVVLYDRILDTWETGVLTTKASNDEAYAKVTMEGGYSALLKKHPWLQLQPQRQGSTMVSARSVEEEEPEEGSEAPVEVVDELPLAERQWRKVHADADKAILDARLAAEQAAARAMTEALDAVGGLTVRGTPKRGKVGHFNNKHLVDYLASRKGEAVLQKRKLAAQISEESLGWEEGDDEYAEEAFELEEDLGNREGGKGAAPTGTAGAVTQDDKRPKVIEKKEAEADEMDTSRISLDDISLPPASSSSCSGGGGGGSGEGGSSSNKAHTNSTSLSSPIIMSPIALSSASDGGSGNAIPSGRKRLSVRFALIPTYLRGGEDHEGLGEVLGNALAVLYVARHGLTVDELMHLLTELRQSSDKKLYAAVWKHRDLLLETFQELDQQDKGVLDSEEVEKVMLRIIDPRLKSTKLERLIIMSNSAALDNRKVIVYRMLVDYCGNAHCEQPLSTNQLATTSFLDGEDEAAAAVGNVNTRASAKEIRAWTTLKSSGTLKEGLESTLLQILTSLGVMLANDNDILVLTLESEALREVVHRRYVRADEGGEEKWHNAVMKYFQSQPSSLRRCEELPWHLHICRRWNSLKDTLSDLWAFELMYLGRLKHEFFEYWRILTEGPLYVSESYEAAVREKVGGASMILSDLDTAKALGLTDSRAQKEIKLQGQMATFDLVDCYNLAIEHWRSEARPTTYQLAQMLHLIAQFLAEFSEGVKFQKTFPRFLRKPLSLESMKLVGIDDQQYLPKRLVPTANAGQGTLGGSSTTSFGNGNGGNALTFEQQQKAIAQALADDASHYYYKRWIWMQFPWIALANTSLALKMFGKDLQTASSEEVIAAAGSTVSGGGELSLTGGNGNGAVNSHHQSKMYVPDQAQTFKRMWLVKKQDPTQAKAVGLDSIQFHSMIKAYITHIAPHAENTDRLIKAAYHDKSDLMRRLVEREKFDPTPKCSTEGVGRYFASSKKAQNHGTRVPSVEHMLQQAHKDEAEKMDLITTSAIKRFGGVRHPKTVQEMIKQHENSTPFAPGSAFEGPMALPLSAKEKQLMDAGNKLAGLRAVLDKIMAEKAGIKRRLVDLQRTAEERDAQDGITMEKIETGEYVIEALQVRLARMQAAVFEAEALGGFYSLIMEQCIKNPARDQKRLGCLDQQLALATSQLRDLNHQRHLVYMEKEHVEKEDIPKMNIKVEQLHKDRKKVQQRLHALGVRNPDLSKYTSKFTSSLEHAMTSTSTSTTTQGRSRRILSNNSGISSSEPTRRSTRVGMWASNLLGLGKKVLTPSGQRRRQGEASPKEPQPTMIFKRLERIRAAMEQLFEIAGTEEADGIIDKMLNSQRLNEGLMEQRKDYETKIAALRVELQREETKLQAVNVDNSMTEATAAAATSSSNKVLSNVGAAPGAGAAPEGGGEEEMSSININEAIFKEEMRCVKNCRMMLTVQQFLDQIKMGVNHLGRLTAKYALSSMGTTIRASLDGAHHEENLDDADVYKVLSTFEERISLLKEAVSLDMSDQRDGLRALSSTFSATTTSGGGANTPLGSQPSGTMMAMLSLMDEGKKKAPLDAGGHVIDNSLVGIDANMVLYMKGEREMVERYVSFSKYAAKPKKRGGLLLKNSSDRNKIRISTGAAVEEHYENETEELQKNFDDSMDRIEAEAEHQVAEASEETEVFIRSALSSADTQLSMRQMVIRELDVESRQYSQVDEGEGLAIKNALLDANVSVSKTLGALNPASIAQKDEACLRPSSSSSSRKTRGGSKKKPANERIALPPMTRDQIKAASNILVAKKTPKPPKVIAGRKNGRIGKGAGRGNGGGSGKAGGGIQGDSEDVVAVRAA